MNENCLPLLDNSNLQLTKSSLAQVACYNYLERFLEGLVPGPRPQQMLVSWVSVWAWAVVAFGACQVIVMHSLRWEPLVLAVGTATMATSSEIHWRVQLIGNELGK